MKIKKEDIENRITLYSIISRLMIIEVDNEFLNFIENNSNILELFPNYKNWDKRKEFSNKILKERYLDVDYANLFLLHLVPYESFYTRNDQMIESGGDNPVLQLYNKLDFKVALDKARVVSPDHIGVEFEFMYMLNIALDRAFKANDSDGVREILKMQKEFLQKHLLNWSPMFLINMKKEARTPLYHDGAELALEFLLSDFEYINEKLKELE
jgi:TorA maturation chaperone TorD